MSSETEREVAGCGYPYCGGNAPECRTCTQPAFVARMMHEQQAQMRAAQAAEPPRDDGPISLDNDPRRQELFGAAIPGAMAFGYQGVNEPPKGHWLTPHWQTGRAQAEQTAAVVSQALNAQAAEAGEADARDARIAALEKALQHYAESCDATETQPCGYTGNLCCKVARAALKADSQGGEKA